MKKEYYEITYLAFDQAHVEIFHKDTPLYQVKDYLYNMCHTFLITDISPIYIKSNIDEDGC